MAPNATAQTSPKVRTVAPKSKDEKLFPLMVESLEHMNLTPRKKEFARAVLRAAIEYVCMRQAGFVIGKPKPKLTAAEVKTETLRILDTEGLIPAIKFYRAALHNDGDGQDPGLHASLHLIRDNWDKEKRKKARKPKGRK